MTSNPSRSAIRLETLSVDKVKEAYEIEKASYPEDEAASLEGMRYRQANAGEFFQGLFLDDELIGFINSTLVHGALTEESMSMHDPSGETLCIHSVVISQNHRRKGHAAQMLKDYIGIVKALNEKREKKVKTVALICKEHLVGMYAGAGFKLIGPSEVCHGKDPWMDMDMAI